MQTVFRAFVALDDDKNGMLSKDEILNHCGVLRENPLVDRVLEIFDSDNNGEVDFGEFVKHLQVFCDLKHSEHKLQCNLTYDSSHGRLDGVIKSYLSHFQNLAL